MASERIFPGSIQPPWRGSTESEHAKTRCALRTRTPRAVAESERFVEIMAAGRTARSQIEILGASDSMASLDESYLPNGQTNNHEVRLRFDSRSPSRGSSSPTQWEPSFARHSIP